jgi:hypothetical protein
MSDIMTDEAWENAQFGLAERIDELDYTIDMLCEALEQGAEWFEEYERLHLAKDTPEGRNKAATNHLRAQSLRSAVKHARDVTDSNL